MTEYSESIQAQQPVQDSLFREHLPRRPYCSETKPIRLRIRDVKRAIKYPYIQLNEPWRRVWLVADIDRPGAACAWEDAGMAPPTYTAVNKSNGHAHSGWLLGASGVLMGDHSRSAPMRYLEAIEDYMTNKLEADPGYTGLIAKNPLSPEWLTLYGERQPYTLDWLADYLPGIEKWRRPESAQLCGVGRNVDTFDSVRMWSYVRVLDRKRDGVTLAAWTAELVDRCCTYTNTAHPASPLSMEECRHIARSIAKWTYRVFSLARFSEIQSKRGRRGMAKRWGDPTERNAAIAALVAEGLSCRQIADRVGCHYSTVSRVVNAWLLEGAGGVSNNLCIESVA